MSNNMIKNAIFAVLSLSLAGITAAVLANNSQVPENKPSQDGMQAASVQGMEKCFGIVKVGANDCANASHGCSGEAKINNDNNEWIFVPTGLCKKIGGGNTKPASES